MFNRGSSQGIIFNWVRISKVYGTVLNDIYNAGMLAMDVFVIRTYLLPLPFVGENR